MSDNKITTALELIGETLRCSLRGTIRGFSFEVHITKEDTEAAKQRLAHGLFKGDRP